MYRKIWCCPMPRCGAFFRKNRHSGNKHEMVGWVVESVILCTCNDDERVAGATAIKGDTHACIMRSQYEQWWVGLDIYRRLPRLKNVFFYSILLQQYIHDPPGTVWCFREKCEEGSGLLRREYACGSCSIRSASRAPPPSIR